MMMMSWWCHDDEDDDDDDVDNGDDGSDDNDDDDDDDDAGDADTCGECFAPLCYHLFDSSEASDQKLWSNKCEILNFEKYWFWQFFASKIKRKSIEKH